ERERSASRHFACDRLSRGRQLQESQADFYVRRSAFREELGLQRGWLAAAARADDAEVEPLLVLERRRAVGIEEIALVEHRVGNLLDGSEVHGLTNPRQL